MKYRTETLNALADYAHEAWAGWMMHLFEKSQANTDGTVTIPKNLVDRWHRQAHTLYSDLPENEQLSDVDEAVKILNTIRSVAHLNEGK